MLTDCCVAPAPSESRRDLNASAAPSSQRNGLRVCMITHSSYESDNRVLRYAEALAERGDSVDVLALRQNSSMDREEVLRGVRIFRIQDRIGKTEQTKSSFVWPLLRFLVKSSSWLFSSHRRHRYDLIHVHNIPDFLVLAALYPKLSGSRVILDVHDIVPELFASKFGANEASPVVHALRLVERLSAALADHVIIANDLWLPKYVQRSARAEKCSVFINHVDERIFHPLSDRSAAAKRIILFPGGLQWHQGVDIAIRAFAQLRVRLPDTEFHIYGDGSAKTSLIALVEELKLKDSVRFFPPQRLHEIAGIMAASSLGVVPKRADSFGDEAYSTKIMEFMAVRVPVVVSSTKVDRFYFDDSVVRFFESGNVTALSEAMNEVLTNEDLRMGLINRAAAYAEANGWQKRKTDYLQLVDQMCGGGKAQCVERC